MIPEMLLDFIADIPEDLQQEVYALHRIGVSIDEIKYVISRKLKNFYNRSRNF
ncbi:MAG: hypothetical protein AABX79_01330 [Nanoarchaeota archaeon]